MSRVGVNIRPDGEPSYLSHFEVSDEYRPGFRRIAVSQTSVPFNKLLFSRVNAELEGTDFTPKFDARYQSAQRQQRPRWFDWVPRPDTDGESFQYVSGRAAGWPWLCLCSKRSQTAADAQPRISGAFQLIPGTWYKLSFTDPDLGALPLIPIWPGLLANTAVYSSPWLLLMFIYPFARRSLRRRRGLCPACAYDIRATPAGSPCPECGAVH